MKIKISHIGQSIWNKKHVIIPLLIFIVLLLAIAPYAYADDSSAGTYMDIDPKGIFSSDGKGGSNLWSGLTDILQLVVTGILLPVGILMSAWRVIYIAIFPIMIHTDPLDLLRNDRYTKNRATTGALGEQKIAESFFGGKYNKESGTLARGKGGGSGKTSYSGSAIDSNYFSGVYASGGDIADAPTAIKHEIKNMFVGLLITFSIWVFLQIIMHLAVFLLGFAETIKI